MSFLSQYPHIKIIQTLARKKHLDVYLVGGFLRDNCHRQNSLRNKNPLILSQLDFDFAVEKNAIVLARQFADRIKGAFVLLDAEHGCARVVKKSDGQVMTFDFADFRDKNIKGDVAARDFTINTLCAHLNKFADDDDIDSQIIDLKGAVKDLRAGVVRMVSARAFKDDPLRLMRAYSLQAVFGFKIEAGTIAQIKKDAKRIRDVSMERVREELFKILGSPRACQVLRQMDKTGLLEQIIPQLTVMFGVVQGGYHHLDVWKHSLEVVAQFEKILKDMAGDQTLMQYFDQDAGGKHPRYAIVKLAALLHDIGKPQTKKIENDRTSFHGHEHVGRHITRVVCKHLKLSVRERHMLEDMVVYHLRPGYLSNFKTPSEKSIFRFFRDTKEESVSVLLLSLADQRSTRGPLTTQADQKHHEKICLDLVARFFQEQNKTPTERIIDGHDLIKKLKLKPSPVFTKILRAVQEARALGKISNKKQALELAAKIAKV